MERQVGAVVTSRSHCTVGAESPQLVIPTSRQPLKRVNARLRRKRRGPKGSPNICESCRCVGDVPKGSIGFEEIKRPIKKIVPRTDMEIMRLDYSYGTHAIVENAHLFFIAVVVCTCYNIMTIESLAVAQRP